MTRAHTARIEAAARDSGVPHEPWLAWARERALIDGPDLATTLAVIGSTFEPLWGDADEPTSWWRRVTGWRRA